MIVGPNLKVKFRREVPFSYRAPKTITESNSTIEIETGRFLWEMGGNDAEMWGPRLTEAIPPSTNSFQVTLGISVQVGEEGGNVQGPLIDRLWRQHPWLLPTSHWLLASYMATL